MISVKDLLIIGLAVAIAAYLLTPRTPASLPYPALGQHSYETRHGACAQVGARNHSGVTPYDPFGFCSSTQGRDYDGGRDLPDEGGDHGLRR
jgi:hypothetical protein